MSKHQQTDHPVVLITGSRKGIGRYLVDHFLDKSLSVEGCSRQPFDESLDNYHHHIADVKDETQVKAMMASIYKRHGRLDILINNAGIASMNHILLTPMETVSRIIDTNFLGTFLICREGAKLMKQRRYGRIVNIGTVAVPLLLAGEAAYAASKSAVITFTQILAREVSEWGITCNVVSPAPIETDLIGSVPPEKIQAIIDQLAIRRLGSFEDVAHVIDFLTDPASDYITGQVITLGGI